MAHSPRWDSVLARITVAEPGAYTREDTRQVTDPSQRPTDWDYDRYLWLVGELRRCRYDDEQIRLRTFAGFAPLLARTADAGQRAAQLRLLDSADFCGHPGFRWRLLPSTSPAEPAFEPRNYWRGPVWPVISWLLWQSLSQLGYAARADEIRRASLGQIAETGEFAEYFEPFTGGPLGSARQSWTAAVALDWAAPAPGRQADRPPGPNLS